MSATTTLPTSTELCSTIGARTPIYMSCTHTTMSVRSFVVPHHKLLPQSAVFTQGQVWPSGIVLACVCLSVCSSRDGLVGCKCHLGMSMTCMWAYLRACGIHFTGMSGHGNKKMNVKFIYTNLVLDPTHELSGLWYINAQGHSREYVCLPVCKTDRHKNGLTGVWSCEVQNNLVKIFIVWGSVWPEIQCQI